MVNSTDFPGVGEVRLGFCELWGWFVKRLAWPSLKAPFGGLFFFSPGFCSKSK